MPELILILIRSIISFVVLLILTRLMGKQQLSQLTFFDYVVGITIGSIAAAMAVDQNIKILNGVVGLVIWGGFPILLSVLAMKSKGFRKLTDGQPTVVIKNGKVQENKLKKLMMTVEELMQLLREKNVYKLSDVEMAIVELDGELSVMKKSDAQPVTPKILGLLTEEEQQPQIVVLDGNLLEKSLNKTSYTRQWLLGEVMKQGASDFSDVFLAQIDAKGNVYVDLYQDNLKKPEVQAKPLLKASLKKTQADLELFASQTENKKAKQMYQEQAEKLQKLINGVGAYLK
ncbi:MAG TPA: DUF421 domain-containing protein [Bacillales bacterium]|nr:DUF421 domain-containing protein [Bacillales bacterium]